MVEPMQSRGDWVDLRSIQRLVERAVRHPRTSPEDGWPAGGRPALGPHWALVDHDWHRRRIRSVGGAEVVDLDEQLTRFALTVDGRLVRADLSRSVVLLEGDVATDAPWRSAVHALSPRDVRSLDQRPVESSVDHGSVVTWGTRPTGEPFLSWPGAGLELLLKALIL